MKLLFVCNDRAYFEAHRRSLADAAAAEGWDVRIACGGMDEGDATWANGVIPLKVVRHGLSPFADFGLGLALIRLVRDLRPDVVHLITLKPALVGGVALRLSRFRPRIVATFPGLGRVFDPRETGMKSRLRRFLTLAGLRFGYSRDNTRGLFETETDRRELLGAGVLSEPRAIVVAGAGVDDRTYRLSPLPQGPLRILFAARLLRSKGAHLLAQAAQMLGGSVEFVVAGCRSLTIQMVCLMRKCLRLRLLRGSDSWALCPQRTCPASWRLPMLLFCRLRIAKVFRAS